MSEELEKARDEIINTAMGWSFGKGDSVMDRFEWKLFESINDYRRLLSKESPF